MEKVTRNDALLIHQAAFKGCDQFAKEYLVRKGFARFETARKRETGPSFYIDTIAAEIAAAILSPPNA